MISDPPVLYVVMCGSYDSADTIDLVRRARDDGWATCAILTPMATRFLSVDQVRELEEITGYPVRSEYKDPAEPDVLPVADCFVVAPATFNTTNKVANGITDTLAVGLVCEGIGRGRPVIVAPWPNRALARHGAWRRSVEHLRADGVRLVLIDRTEPGGTRVPQPEDVFPWDAVRLELAQAKKELAEQRARQLQRPFGEAPPA